jgi:NADH-quinone oxidoreductase subunit F
MKWQFVPKDNPSRSTSACNADESEPGTFKDHVLMERDPHLLIEGCAIGCYAIGSQTAYIYIRGEFLHVQGCSTRRSLEQAYAAGSSGGTSSAPAFDCDIYVHRGAGAYEAARRRRSSSRSRASAASRASSRRSRRSSASTAARRSSTTSRRSCNVPLDHRPRRRLVRGVGPREERRAEAVLRQRARGAPGHLRGAVDADTLRELIYDHAGGIRDGRQLKAVIPGGSSVPGAEADEIDVQASFDGS